MHSYEPTTPLTTSTVFHATQRDGEPSGDGSAFADLDAGADSVLSPSLLADLRRFGDEVDAIDLLPALAASVRHGKSLALHLRLGDSPMRVCVFPRAQLFHCETALCDLPPSDLARLQLVRIDPNASPTLEQRDGTPTTHSPFGQLAVLLWRMAEHGSRGELLPEIAGRVRYRIAPGFSTQELPVDASALPLIQRLRANTASLKELSDWTPRGPDRVSRLLNALYLQAALMVLRVSPKVELPRGGAITDAANA